MWDFGAKIHMKRMKHAFKMCLFCSALWSSGRTKITRWKRTSARTWKKTTSAIIWKMMTVKSGSSTISTGLVIWMHLLIRLNCCSSKSRGNKYRCFHVAGVVDNEGNLVRNSSWIIITQALKYGRTSSQQISHFYLHTRTFIRNQPNDLR